MTGLTDPDRDIITRARELSHLRGADVIAEHVGTADPDLIYPLAFGEAQHLLGELAAIAGRPAAEAAEDTGRLNAIRGVLAWFDWEHGDRQPALEAIDRIVEGGQA